MATGKKQNITSSKKGGKKKSGDPFLKKEWYNVKAPAMFKVRDCGKTPVNKTAAGRISSELLKGRVVEVNLADLMANADYSYRKLTFEILDVQGKNCLTDFHGMDFTRDRLFSLIKKWHTLIEGHVDVKTTDGYVLRVFVIGFTDRVPESTKLNCYASSSQVKRIRNLMIQEVADEASTNKMEDFAKSLISEKISLNILKKSKGIVKMRDIYIRKVKVIKKPKLDLTKLMELHTEKTEEGKETESMGDVEESDQKKIVL